MRNNFEVTHGSDLEEALDERIVFMKKIIHFICAKSV